LQKASLAMGDLYLKYRLPVPVPDTEEKPELPPESRVVKSSAKKTSRIVKPDLSDLI
jgi:hypothetical protein